MSQGKGPYKLILSSIIAFSRKTVCRNLYLRPHDGFSWDKVQIVPNSYSYGPKSCNFKVFICKYILRRPIIEQEKLAPAEVFCCAPKFRCTVSRRSVSATDLLLTPGSRTADLA